MIRLFLLLRNAAYVILINFEQRIAATTTIIITVFGYSLVYVSKGRLLTALLAFIASAWHPSPFHTSPSKLLAEANVTTIPLKCQRLAHYAGWTNDEVKHVITHLTHR